MLKSIAHRRADRAKQFINSHCPSPATQQPLSKGVAQKGTGGGRAGGNYLTQPQLKAETRLRLEAWQLSEFNGGFNFYNQSTTTVKLKRQHLQQQQQQLQQHSSSATATTRTTTRLFSWRRDYRQPIWRRLARAERLREMQTSRKTLLGPKCRFQRHDMTTSGCGESVVVVALPLSVSACNMSSHSRRCGCSLATPSKTDDVVSLLMMPQPTSTPTLTPAPASAHMHAKPSCSQSSVPS